MSFQTLSKVILVSKGKSVTIYNNSKIKSTIIFISNSGFKESKITNINKNKFGFSCNVMNLVVKSTQNTK